MASTSSDLPGVAQRFLRYVRIDTQSDPKSDTVPSTEKQKDLSRLLAGELQALGLDDAVMDVHGYVFATLPSTLPAEQAARTPVLALIAHVDTSPDESGTNVNPVVHPPYQGSAISLPGAQGLVLDASRDPELLNHVGENLITSDGTTLLGSDDKAGVAIIMQLVEEALRDPATPRPTIRVCFTVDEEIGRGVDHLDLDVLNADVAYTLDGSGIDTLSAETFHAAEAVVTVRGVIVHPGYAKGIMVNALRIIADVIASLPASAAPETTDGEEGYYHPHSLSASDPSHAVVRMLLRDFEGEGLAVRKRFIENRIEALRATYPGATIELKITDTYKNMRTYIEASDPRTISFALEAARSEGIPLTMERVRGGTDGAQLSEQGLPTPNVFTGGRQFHSRLEWNTVQNLERALRYLKALVRYWGENGAKTD